AAGTADPAGTRRVAHLPERAGRLRRSARPGAHHRAGRWLGRRAAAVHAAPDPAAPGLPGTRVPEPDRPVDGPLAARAAARPGARRGYRPDRRRVLRRP